MAKPTPLREIAAHLGRAVEGDGELVVSGVASLEEAGPTDLGFARTRAYAGLVARSRAGALILPHGMDGGDRPLIRSPNPGLDFARAVAWLEPGPRPEPGIHPAAWVAPGARVDPTAAVGPRATVGERTHVGARSVVHAGAALASDVRVGEDCTIHSGVVVREGTRIGDRVILQPGCVIGGDGFGYVPNEGGTAEKVPHVGGVVLEDDVEIGANSTVDRGSLGDTRIGRNTKIDNLVQIGHNCDIGEDVFIVAQSGVSGSAKVGDRSMLMSQSGVTNGADVGAGAFVASRTGVTRNVPDGTRAAGFPNTEFTHHLRIAAVMLRLPEMARRLRAVERKLGIRGRRDDRGDA